MPVSVSACKEWSNHWDSGSNHQTAICWFALGKDVGVGGGGGGGGAWARAFDSERFKLSHVCNLCIFIYVQIWLAYYYLSLARSLAYHTLSLAHTFSLSLHPPSPTSPKCLSQQVQYKIQKAIKTQAHLQPTYKTNTVHLIQSNSKLMQETCSTPLPTTELNPLKWTGGGVGGWRKLEGGGLGGEERSLSSDMTDSMSTRTYKTKHIKQNIRA